MKKNILIIILLIVSLLGAFCLKANAQEDSAYYSPGFECRNSNVVYKEDPKKTLIADETWLKFYNTGAKITTTLESVFQDISLKWGEEFKKITITYKSANGQRYKEYIITISEQTARNIQQWAKKNL